MKHHPTLAATAFQSDRLICAGPLKTVAPAVKAALDAAPDAPVLVFDDMTGRVIDLHLRGSDEEIIARLGDGAATLEEQSAPAKRGRPKLGVVAREVTLLPRHWEWLAVQPGGASNALRRLTEAAMRADQGAANGAARREAAYRFMSAMAGDFPGFEEATRALFAGDKARFAEQTANWPADIGRYAADLAWGVAVG